AEAFAGRGLPEMHDAATVIGGVHGFAVRTDGNARDPAVAGPRRNDEGGAGLLAGRHIPAQSGEPIVAGKDGLRVAVEGRTAADPSAVLQGVQLAAACDPPQSRRAVLGAGDGGSIVRAGSNGVNHVAVLQGRADGTARLGIPE